MSLKDFEKDMLRCPRCSECKWIPLAQIKSWRFAQACPSIGKYNFHAYSAGGRLIMGLSMLTNRFGYTDDFLDILYKCHMCGACDIACKCNKDMEPLAITQELRIKAVEDGHLHPVHMIILDDLRKEDNMMQGKKADRGKWADDLDVKNITHEKAEVYFHAGCRYCFDEDLWPAIRGAVSLLKKAGVDLGIMGKDEVCCGGRIYELGYKGEFIKYAENNLDMLKAAGIKRVVTSCADGYYTFKVLYPMVTKRSDVEVLHITEYIDQLIKEGKLKVTKNIPMRVTYHDPCHLGRLGEPYQHWEGVEKKVFNHMYIYDPPKPWRKGANGVYQAPRDILTSIPGINLIEMERIKEYAWCCGAGSGVREAYPELSSWTALERIEEAKTTEAEAIITACPWCKRNFSDAIQETSAGLKVYDIMELLEQSL